MTIAQKQRIYFGTYTHVKANQEDRPEGIYIYAFDASNGRLEFISTVANVVNPSFLILSADRRFLYAVNELQQFAGEAGGGASAYGVDPATGALSFLNAQPTHGDDPCYVLLDQTGKWALVANYTGGSLTEFPVRIDGGLDASSAVIQHHGHGFDPERQGDAHVHSAIFDPAQRYLLVADLGMDQVVIYDFDHATGQLSAHNPAAIVAAPGAGPRHMAFHPNSRFFYVIHELNSTVVVYEFEAEHGTFAPLQTISTLPADWSGTNLAADLHFSASGRYLYGSNRGHNSLVVYAVDAATGRLTLVEFVACGGDGPRNFGLDLTGTYMIVGHQYSGTVATFRINGESGRLTQTAQVIQIPYPVCVRVVAAD